MSVLWKFYSKRTKPSHTHCTHHRTPHPLLPGRMTLRSRCLSFGSTARRYRHSSFFKPFRHAHARNMKHHHKKKTSGLGIMTEHGLPTILGKRGTCQTSCTSTSEVLIEIEPVSINQTFFFSFFSFFLHHLFSVRGRVAVVVHGLHQLVDFHQPARPHLCPRIERKDQLID